MTLKSAFRGALEGLFAILVVLLQEYLLENEGILKHIHNERSICRLNHSAIG
jgi:hypothetical protein